MEFFAAVKNPGFDPNSLKQQLTIARLPARCQSIDKVISDNGDQGVIYCLWGEFEINREELKYGFRFSFPRCPNALACSITLDEGDDDIVIHCTINKQQHDEDFIESIQQFVSDWAEGMKTV